MNTRVCVSTFRRRIGRERNRRSGILSKKTDYDLQGIICRTIKKEDKGGKCLE